MNMYFDNYDSYFVDKTNENSGIDSLFIVSKLISTTYLQRRYSAKILYIKIFGQGSHIRPNC